MKRTISFRYPDEKSMDDFLKVMLPLILDRGFSESHNQIEYKALFSKEEIEQAEELLFGNDSGEPEDGESLVPSLSEDRVSALTQPVRFASILFERLRDQAKIKLFAAEGNYYPVIGQDVWLQSTLALPGGMFIIESDDTIEIDELCETITRFSESGI